jgi:hypothetical protein
LFVQRRSTGNIQIFSKQANNIDLRDLLRLLRMEEARLSGLRVTSDWKVLETDETIEGLPQWFYREGSPFILNGSNTCQAVTPTKIGMDRILELVVLSFSDNAEPVRRCPTGSVCRGRACGFYDAGLLHCRNIRFVWSQRR